MSANIHMTFADKDDPAELQVSKCGDGFVQIRVESNADRLFLQITDDVAEVLEYALTCLRKRRDGCVTSRAGAVLYGNAVDGTGADRIALVQ